VVVEAPDETRHALSVRPVVCNHNDNAVLHGALECVQTESYEYVVDGVSHRSVFRYQGCYQLSVLFRDDRN
jgi:hypothetical protein